MSTDTRPIYRSRGAQNTPDPKILRYHDLTMTAIFSCLFCKLLSVRPKDISKSGYIPKLDDSTKGPALEKWCVRKDTERATRKG